MRYAYIITAVMLLASCSTSRRHAESSVSDSTFASSYRDSVRTVQYMHSVASAFDRIQIHTITYDTSRTDSIGNPMKLQETTATIFHSDSTYTTTETSTVSVSDSIAYSSSHAEHQELTEYKAKATSPMKYLAPWLVLAIAFLAFGYVLEKRS